MPRSAPRAGAARSNWARAAVGVGSEGRPAPWGAGQGRCSPPLQATQVPCAPAGASRPLPALARLNPPARPRPRPRPRQGQPDGPPAQSPRAVARRGRHGPGRPHPVGVVVVVVELVVVVVEVDGGAAWSVGATWNVNAAWVHVLGVPATTR